MKEFKSGLYINQGYYKSFQPNPINHSWVIDNMEIITSFVYTSGCMGMRFKFHRHAFVGSCRGFPGQSGGKQVMSVGKKPFLVSKRQNGKEGFFLLT